MLSGLELKNGTIQQSGKETTIFDKFIIDTHSTIQRDYRTKLRDNYKNILSWRNAYAHGDSINITLGEVYEAHRIGKYGIQDFAMAFNVY